MIIVVTCCVVQYGLGVMRAMYTTDDTMIDIIPVDFTANAIIAAGWHTATRRSVRPSQPLYQKCFYYCRSEAAKAVYKRRCFFFYFLFFCFFFTFLGAQSWQIYKSQLKTNL
jgi:hypothetical protein